jgi:hypothetical protein
MLPCGEGQAAGVWVALSSNQKSEKVPSVLRDVIGVVTEFMVRRSGQQSLTEVWKGAFSVATQFMGTNGKKWASERHAIDHTHARASSEQPWDPMASSRVKLTTNNEHRAITVGPAWGGEEGPGDLVPVHCQLSLHVH